MAILRLLLAGVSLSLALGCGWGAYVIHVWNAPPKHWLLAGPFQVCGYTVSPSTGVAVLGLLAMLFVFLGAYALLGSKSGK